MRQSGCRLIGWQLGKKSLNRGTVWGKASRTGLWGGRRVTGAFTRNLTGVPLRCTPSGEKYVGWQIHNHREARRYFNVHKNSHSVNSLRIVCRRYRKCDERDFYRQKNPWRWYQNRRDILEFPKSIWYGFIPIRYTTWVHERGVWVVLC